MSHNPAFTNTTAGALDTSAASDATLRQQGLGGAQPQPPPTHHLHRSSDVLPGARGYPQNLDQPDAAYSSGAAGTGMGAGAGMDSGADLLAPRRGQQDFAANDFAQRGTGAGGRSAFTEERPLGVQPTDRGEPSLHFRCPERGRPWSVSAFYLLSALLRSLRRRRRHRRPVGPPHGPRGDGGQARREDAEGAFAFASARPGPSSCSSV